MGCSQICRHLFFGILFLLDVADLISDWLLYIDVSIIEKGLVYGPVDEPVIRALLVFSIVGSVFFLLEAINLWLHVYRDRAIVDVDIVSMIVIWFEDLPQIALNVHIALCREDPISVFQLSKASMILIALLVRIIISCVVYCRNKKDAESKRWHLPCRVLIMLGLIINAGCAIAIFLFTQTHPDMEGGGGVKFKVPTSLFGDDYNEQRYFQNVSVFIHHPDFDDIAPGQANKVKVNWVRLVSVNDIRNGSHVDIRYNYMYENTATHLKMALFVKEVETAGGQLGSWRMSECYEMELTSRLITSVNNSRCRSCFFSQKAKRVFITFVFTAPRRIFKRLIFGDIQFNVKVYENGQCKEISNFADSVNDNATVPAILYYRTHPSLNPASSRHLLVESGTPRFYRQDRNDLQDITEVWKTGFWNCDTSSSIAPHFRASIPVDCSNIF